MQTQRSIAVIGCGGIGSRHAQALGKLNLPAKVYGLDFSREATQRAAQFFEESKRQSGSPASFTAVNDYADLPVTIEVAIVATRATHRLEALQRLLHGRTVKHLVLEKFLFSHREHFSAANRLLSACAAGVWVNCPRRIYPVYREIALRVHGARFVDIHVTASARIAPVGTIGVHFADLLHFLCGAQEDQFQMVLDEASVLPGNRQLSDFAGTLSMSFPGKGRLRFESLMQTDAPQLVSIASDTARYVIEERDQFMLAASAEQGWRSERRDFPVPVQSALSHLVAQELLTSDTCGLTPYADSARIHIALFDILMSSFRAIRHDPYIEELPFT